MAADLRAASSEAPRTRVNTALAYSALAVYTIVVFFAGRSKFRIKGTDSNTSEKPPGARGEAVTR